MTKLALQINGKSGYSMNGVRTIGYTHEGKKVDSLLILKKNPIQLNLILK